MSSKVITKPQQKKEIDTPIGNSPVGTQFEYFKSDQNKYRKNSNNQEFRIEGNGSKIILSQIQV